MGSGVNPLSERPAPQRQRHQSAVKRVADPVRRGIDVGTKAEVHGLLSELASRGIGILMISSELPEVLGMADRILVVREGQITADISRSDATAESVMFAASHAQEPVK